MLQVGLEESDGAQASAEGQDSNGSPAACLSPNTPGATSSRATALASSTPSASVQHTPGPGLTPPAGPALSVSVRVLDAAAGGNARAVAVDLLPVELPAGDCTPQQPAQGARRGLAVAVPTEPAVPSPAAAGDVSAPAQLHSVLVSGFGDGTYCVHGIRSVPSLA